MTQRRTISQVLSNARAIELAISNVIKDNSGYETFTTFGSDIAIALICEGIKGLRETHARVCKEWLSNYKYFTEYILIMNHMGWLHYQFSHDTKNFPDEGFRKREHKWAQACFELYEDADRKFLERYEGNEEALAHHFQVTD